jgi:hypothetical protein
MTDDLTELMRSLFKDLPDTDQEHVVEVLNVSPGPKPAPGRRRRRRRTTKRGHTRGQIC